MTNVSTPMRSFFALETFDSEFLKVLLIMQFIAFVLYFIRCFVMQKDIDAQESIENLPNLAKKIAIKCTVSQACLFSLWTETIGLNIKYFHLSLFLGLQ
jgi:uncharacterized membrane protein